MELRDYQRALIDLAIPRLAERPILVLPTGAGKTFTCAAMLRELGMRTLWIAHRRELIFQAADTLARCGIKTALILAGQPTNPQAHVQVASIQTLARRTAPKVELVVIDEAHHATAKGYRRLVDQYPGVPIVGLTATPFRLDGRGLGGAGFGAILCTATCADLCRDGTLIEPDVYAPDAPDRSQLKVRMGDFETSAMASLMNTPSLVGNLVTTWQRRAADRKTLCFAVDVRHSHSIVQRFQEVGVAAEHLDGTTPADERAAILARLRDGTTTVLSNVGIVSEGFDLPALDVAIIARPTASLCWHLQAVGRIMRACADKAGAIVLDHAGNHLVHGFVTDPVAYSLEGNTAKKGAGAAPVKRCPNCEVVVPAGTMTCPECGYRWPERGVVEQDGELHHLNEVKRAPLDQQQLAWQTLTAKQQRRGYKPGWRVFQFKRLFGIEPTVVDDVIVDPGQATREQKAAVYADLQATAAEKGFKPGWAAHRYRDQFGVWPRGLTATSASRAAPPTPPPTLGALRALLASALLPDDDLMAASVLHDALAAGSKLTAAQQHLAETLLATTARSHAQETPA